MEIQSVIFFRTYNKGRINTVLFPKTYCSKHLEYEGIEVLNILRNVSLS
jgi:hypothetical protein